MNSVIKLGLEKGLISLNEDKTRITYNNWQNLSRNFKNPEELVQAVYRA